MSSVLFRALSVALAFLMATPILAGNVLQYRLTVDGAERGLLLYVPDPLPPGPRPLVLVLHGGAGSDRSIMRITRRRFEELADRDGWLVAYPNSNDGVWRFASDPINSTFGLTGDDLGYFDEAIRSIRARNNVDGDRIFATGISRGGQASFYIACKRPGLVRAIASVAMPLPAFMADDCAQAPPFGVLIMNGTRDPLVPYGGGAIRVGGNVRAQVLSTETTLNRFAKKNGCSPPDRTEVIDRLDDGMRVLLREWRGCPLTPVREVTVESGGHTWPGGRQYLPKFIIGPVTNEIDGMEVVWEFFRRF